MPARVQDMPEKRDGGCLVWFLERGLGLHRGSYYEHHVDRLRVLHGHPKPRPEGLRWIRHGVYFLLSALHYQATLLVATLHRLGAAFTLRPDAIPVLL
jgi:hypothetical protein